MLNISSVQIIRACDDDELRDIESGLGEIEERPFDLAGIDRGRSITEFYVEHYLSPQPESESDVVRDLIRSVIMHHQCEHGDARQILLSVMAEVG